MLIEYDGKQHYYPINFFGGYNYYTNIHKKDLIKNSFAYHHNIRLIRIPYTFDTKKKISNYLKNILYNSKWK